MFFYKLYSKTKNIYKNVDGFKVTVNDTGGDCAVGGFTGEAERGTYINCSTTSNTFIGKVIDNYLISDDENSKLTVTKAQ